MRKFIFIVASLLIFAFFNYNIYKHEEVKTEIETCPVE